MAVRVLAFLLIGLLTMPDVPLYQQNFTSGTPVFHSDSLFDRPGGDAADSNYPEISYAEGLVINGAGHVDSGHGYNYDSNSLVLTGRYGQPYGTYGAYPGTPPPHVVTEGYLQFRYRPNATSITKDADIVYVYRDNGDWLAVYRDVPSRPLIIEGWNEDQSIHLNETIAWTPTAGTEYLFRLEWKVGDEGYVRLKINGSTVFEDLAFGPWFNGASGGEIHTVQFGGWALFGELWEIEFGTIGSDEPDLSEIPTNESTPCCVGKTPKAKAAAYKRSVPQINPYQALQPFTPSCAGGGTVPSAADLTDPEDWSV